MGILKYELNQRPVNVAAEQEFDPESTNAMSGTAVIEAIHQAFEGLAPEYSATAAYLPGDLVLHEGRIYSALVTIAAPGEAWTAAHWQLVNLNNFAQKEYPNYYVSITYANLVTLRNGGHLIPGRWYRITDYECSTTQQDTQSAGHLFDILVRADDNSHLNENAFAIHHSGDTYFQNSKLEAWKLKYCLDNDASRFGWAADGTGGFYIEYTIKEEVYRIFRTAIIEDKVVVWVFGEGKDALYTTANPQVGDNIYDDAELNNAVQTVSATGTIAGVAGKGVVYWMKDEWDNECPYDFKNIQFKRFEITAVKNGHNNSDYYNEGDHPLVGTWGLPNPQVEVDSETEEWFYTFSSMESGTVVDASLAFDYNPISGQGSGAGQNKMEGAVKGRFFLCNNVFINTQGSLVCSGNTFGCGCFENTFGNNCNSNTFADNCYKNTFGNYFQNNTFGNYFQNNTFGNNCQYNTFGNSCYNNTFGNYCYNNTFGNNCSGNTFGNNCSGNTFGNGCTYNTFGNYCYNNTFGNECYYNTFGNECHYNTFGNYFQNNTFGNYIKNSTVFNGVQYCSVTGGASSSSYVQNAQILNGTAGANANLLTIAFTANVSYTQVAAMNTAGNLTIWNPADLVN